MREATVCGHLYDLPAGFPALVVPEESVRAVGTAEYAADAGLSGRPAGAAVSPLGPAVHGELMTFDDPAERLPAIDGLEDYRPGERGFYRRVLIPVWTREDPVLAWAYVAESATGAHLPGGRWPAG